MPELLIQPWLTLTALRRLGFTRYGTVSDGAVPLFEIEADYDEDRQAVNCVYAFAFAGLAVRVGKAARMGARMNSYQRHVTARLMDFRADRQVQTTLREALGWLHLLNRHQKGEVYFISSCADPRQLETKLISMHTLPLNWTRQ